MGYAIRIIALSAVCVGLVAIAHSLSAYLLFEQTWPPGDIFMEMQLGSSGALVDGSASWDECAIAALDEWNANLAGTGRRFNPIRSSARIPAQYDSINSVFWADDVFGTPFGAQTLAVASSVVRIEDGVNTTTEVDVIFNSAQPFNCYRGRPQSESDNPGT